MFDTAVPLTDAVQIVIEAIQVTDRIPNRNVDRHYAIVYEEILVRLAQFLLL